MKTCVAILFMLGLVYCNKSLKQDMSCVQQCMSQGKTMSDCSKTCTNLQKNNMDCIKACM